MIVSACAAPAVGDALRQAAAAALTTRTELKDELGADLGATIDEIVEWFDVTPDQVKAVIEFAARSLEAPVSGR